jgi:hypothetical protein
MDARFQMAVVARFCLVAALLLSFTGPALSYAYRTAHGLYADCLAGENGSTQEATERRRRCADYIARIFNNWNLNQRPGVCSQHVGRELPRAYLHYWREMGFVSGVLMSAETSLNEFLDSQTQPCPIDPKMTPP